MLTGMKQTMKSPEILKTILVTFASRLDILSACAVLVDLFRHFDLFCSLKTSVVAQMMMMRKATRGMVTLLTANETFSTLSRCSVRKRPRRLLFFFGTVITSSLLTTYIGEVLDNRTTKRQIMTMETRFGVTIRFT